MGDLGFPNSVIEATDPAFQSADATLVDPTNHLGPITFPFTNAATGHGVGDRVVIPAAGHWTLTIQVHTDTTTDYAATTTLTVR